MTTSSVPNPSRNRPRRCLLALLFCGFAVQSHALTVYTVSINSTALSGQTGTLAFDLINGDAAAANNTATISSLTTNGTLGNAMGFALTDTDFFNEVLRDITFGTSLSFTLQLTENRVAPGVDQFSFFLLNAAGSMPLFATSDPLGASSLFAIDISGQAGGDVSTFSGTTPALSWLVTPSEGTAVPERGDAIWMLFCALAFLILFRAMKRTIPARLLDQRLNG